MRTLIVLLMLATPAFAQSQMSSCSVGSTAWAPATEEGCRLKGGVFNSGAYGYVFTVPPGRATSETLSTSSAPSPTCELDWSLVLDRAGSPMCAKELKPAIR